MSPRRAAAKAHRRFIREQENQPPDNHRLDEIEMLLQLLDNELFKLDCSANDEGL